MVLGVTLGDGLELAFELACGLPSSQMWVSREEPSQFMLDPELKEEQLDVVEGGGRHAAAQRKNASAWLRDGDGKRVEYPVELRTAESVLSQLQDSHRYPLLSVLRQELLSWRFYHHFRTDVEAPLRQPQVGIQTPVLGPDGRDLAAALETIREIGDLAGLEEAIDRAFPGSRLVVESPGARFQVALTMPGISRPLMGTELSDGTLRYLCLLAALMSPRPPSLLALNEPETSLHPDLLPALAALIADASRRSQVLVTTHSEALARGIADLTGTAPVLLEKVDGRTRVVEEVR